MRYTKNNDTFKYSDLEVNTKHGRLNYGDMLINYMIEDSCNKIENQLWKGIDDTSDTKLQEFVYNSDFISERGKAGKYLASQGQIFACMIKLESGWVNEFFEITNFVEVKKEVLYIIGQSLVKRVDDMGRELFFEWKVENGKVLKTEFVWQANEVLKTTDRVNLRTYAYPSSINFIPGMIIRNNPASTPDWYQVLDIISELNLLATDIGPEWEKIKTSYRKLGQFSKGEDVQAQIEKIKAGGEVVGDSRLGQQLDIAMSGSNSIANLIQAIVFLEDRALKFSFQGRDADSSGTNKHNMQVGLFNQAHSENVFKKIKQRERDYLRYFNDIVSKVLNSEKLAGIEITHSIYEEGKAAGMQQAIEQAEMLKSQAELNNANAEQAKKGDQNNFGNRME